MKKTFFVIGLLLLVVCGVFAQQVPADLVGKTLYYKYVYTVNSETEAKSIDVSHQREGHYYTFTRNSCYRSDEKGIGLSDGSGVYSYQGEQNNMLVFMAPEYKIYNEISHRYLFFSKDYKQLNRRQYYKQNYSTFEYSGWKYNFWYKIIYVYEQSAPPQETGPVGPDRMW